MTPKEKAKELYEKFFYAIPSISDEGYLEDETSKKCTLIAVDEIFEHIDYIFKELEKDNLPNKFDDEKEYWNEVKIEIEKL